MLWYVVLPQLRPATFIAVIVTVIGALRSFDLVSIMTSGGPFGSSRILSYYMYENWPSANTASAWATVRPSPLSFSPS